MINISAMSLRRGGRLLIADADAEIYAGDRVGLVGANGCGKSSLLALIAGRLAADGGTCRVPADWTVAEVAQQTPSGTQPAIDFVIDGDADLRRTEAAIEQADGAELANLLAHLEQIDGYQAPSRAARLLAGLGFDEAMQRQPVDRLSGGWRMRLNLARALMSRADLLLLDEPTNHLDLDAVLWLEDWLSRYRGTLLLISHDREFVDRICTRILHIEHQRLSAYPGNYSAFERVHAERLARQQAEYRRQRRERQHMQHFVERFRAKATKARQAQSRLKALERMVTIAPAHVDSPFRFRFRTPSHLPSPLLTVPRATVGYAAQPVLDDLELTLVPGDRIGLLGPNGAGKTTLVKLLAGALAPLDGDRHEARHLAIGYFAQHQLERLHPEHSALEHLQQLDPDATEQTLRDHLGGFGFSGDQALAPVAPFSGGEKSRLALALMIYQRPNLLLLDEPTNHLDLEMRQALAQALQSFDGAMVLVSHDRHLLRVCCDRLLLVADGRAREFSGALDDYPAWLAARRAVASEQESNSGVPDRRALRRQAADRRRQLEPFRREVARLEQQLDALHARQAELHKQLADNALYEPTRKAELLALMQDKQIIDADTERLESAWLDAHEALESAEKSIPASPVD